MSRGRQRLGDGRLFVTEHGSDERGARYIVGDLDDLYEIQEDAWYGVARRRRTGTG